MSSCPRVLVPPASVCSCRNASRWVQKAIYAGRAKTAIERVKLKSGVTTAHSLENNRVLDLRAQVRRLSKFLYNVTNIAVDDCKTLTRYRNRGDGSAQGARPPRMDTSAEDGEHHWASTDAQYNWFVSASDLSDALADGNIHLPPGACEFVGEVWKCVVLSARSPTRRPVMVHPPERSAPYRYIPTARNGPHTRRHTRQHIGAGHDTPANGAFDCSYLAKSPHPMAKQCVTAKDPTGKTGCIALLHHRVERATPHV